MKLLVTFIFAVLVISGCNQNNEETNQVQPETQSLHYETNEERDDRLNIRNKTIGEEGGYPQSEPDELNRGDNTSGGNTDIFTNEQSKEIANHLMKQEEIRLAQVAINEEKVVVGVMLNDHDNHAITDEIEKEVQKFEPNKTVIVYTDDIYWDRMSNLKSRLHQSHFPNELKDEIQRLFNPNR